MRVPSPEYLTAASQTSAVLASPSSSRKLLVLDLNGTLLVRTRKRHAVLDHNEKPSKRPRGFKHDNHGDDVGTHGSRSAVVKSRDSASSPAARWTVHPRPFMQSFRGFLTHPSTKTWLDTMIWSSARPENVGYMVDACFGQHVAGLLDVWARDKVGLSKKEYGAKTQTTKDLTKPWGEIRALKAASAPTASLHLPSAHSTLLLDDSPSKAVLQPLNHLCVHEYTNSQLASDKAYDEFLQTGETQAGRMERLREEIKQREVECSSLMTGGNAADVSIFPSGFVPEFSSESQIKSIPNLEKMKHDRATKLAKEAKRKAKKLAKLEHQSTELDINGAAAAGSRHSGRYDETLLAVVGVLDAIRWQSNIASWIKGGGLHGRPSDDVTSESNTPKDEASSKQVNINAGGQPPLSEKPLWFANQSVFDDWVQRGRRALEDLNIPLVPGVNKSA